MTKNRPLLKYCGNHSIEDVLVTANSQADYLGFIFAKSKRQVASGVVKEWLSKVNVTQQVVGVFVNEKIENIVDIVNEVPLSIIQCHGDESPQYINQLKEITRKKIWKVIHHGELAPSTMRQYKNYVDGYVIDSKVQGVPGGTGIPFDWTVIPYYQYEAKKQGVPCFIAGGINPETVQTLLDYKPIGIDLSSGIEQEGKKSEKLKLLFEERVFTNV